MNKRVLLVGSMVMAGCWTRAADIPSGWECRSDGICYPPDSGTDGSPDSSTGTGGAGGGGAGSGGAPVDGGVGGIGGASTGGAAGMGTGGTGEGGSGGTAGMGAGGGSTGGGGAGGTAGTGAGGTATGGMGIAGAGEVGGRVGTGGTAGNGGAGAGGTGTGGAYVCGDGMKDPSEECDQGTANKPDAYGKGLCTTQCKNAGYCGDGLLNGPEICDGAGSAATTLGSCNPECTGYYEKKLGKLTTTSYPTNLGGPAGADMKCQAEFGAGWKALLVAPTRRATVTPYAGDGQLDWVIKKYTHYYNDKDELVWRTDGIALLGVRNGARANLYAPFFENGGPYPWSGYGEDWTTLPDDSSTGTCAGWTGVATGIASFVTNDLATVSAELCGGAIQGAILCIQQ